jgi:hypothetical protein
MRRRGNRERRSDREGEGRPGRSDASHPFSGHRPDVSVLRSCTCLRRVLASEACRRPGRSCGPSDEPASPRSSNPNPAGTYEKPKPILKNPCWVHLGFGVMLASHDTAKDPRRWSMPPDRVQIEPAGVTAGKSFSGSNTLLKKFVREYWATSATISMTFASV